MPSLSSLLYWFSPSSSFETTLRFRLGPAVSFPTRWRLVDGFSFASLAKRIYKRISPSSLTIRGSPNKDEHDWTLPTPLESYYCDREAEMMNIVHRYRNGQSLEDTLAEIPEQTGWVHRHLPLMRRCKNSKVLLTLAYCGIRGHKTDIDSFDPKTTAFTEALMMYIEAALVRQGWKLLFINLRKSCKRSEDGQHCDFMKAKEQRLCSIATILELLIAQREFGIEICSVWGFSSYFNTSVDNLIFNTFPDEIKVHHMLRRYTDFHVGKINGFDFIARVKILNRHARLADLCDDLAYHLNMSAPEIWAHFESWFAANKFRTYVVPPRVLDKRTTKGGSGLTERLFSRLFPSGES